jgi:branched-chain amino acid aminotransferase
MHHCYQNGKIQSVADTTMQINDLGLLRGYGLFDYFRTYNGKPFKWERYWQRYENSAKLLRLSNPIQKKEAYKVVLKLLEISGLEDCAFRFVLTGGYSEDSISSPKPNLLIISEDIHSVKPEEYENGIKVISYEYVRDLPEVKSIDYKHLMILQSDIKAASASDVLFHKRGMISELSRSNVFIFKGNTLITPNKNILKGITRNVVLELAKPHFKIEQRNVKISEVLAADEVFTTSSTKRVLAITKIDNYQIGNGKAGEKTKYLLSLINNLIENWT